MKLDTDSLAHTKWNCKYHIVFAPKYRRRVIYGKIKDYASHLIELGVSPLSISERLGHEDIKTTLNTYSHLYPNKQSEIAEMLTEYIV